MNVESLTTGIPRSALVFIAGIVLATGPEPSQEAHVRAARRREINLLVEAIASALEEPEGAILTGGLEWWPLIEPYDAFTPPPLVAVDDSRRRTAYGGAATTTKCRSGGSIRLSFGASARRDDTPLGGFRQRQRGAPGTGHKKMAFVTSPNRNTTLFATTPTARKEPRHA